MMISNTCSDNLGLVRWREAEEDEQPALFDGAERHLGKGSLRGMTFLHVHAKRIVNTVSPKARVPFGHTINVYRGCSHACVYCFARPTHAYLDLGIGEDFDRVIVVKVNAVERLRAELAHPRWTGEAIAMGTNTDPYQRCEGHYRLTRGVVEVLARRGNPFSILTKSPMILRDLDILAEARDASTAFSIGTLDEEVWRLTEPGTPHPMRRVEAVARLVDAGLPCSVLVAPVLPGLSDSPEQLDAVVRACVEAGATSSSSIQLHLRPGVREHFFGWLQQARPDLLASYGERYRTSYARGEQRALSALVGRLVRKHGGRTSSPRATRTVTQPPPKPDQLALL